MEIKRIKDQTIHDAIRKVRDELGPDAVILSTEKTGQGVEILAALDFDPSVLEKKLTPPAPSQELPDMQLLEATITSATEKVVAKQFEEQQPDNGLQEQISQINESIMRLQISVDQDRNKIYDQLNSKIDGIHTTLEEKYLEQQKDRTESFKVLQDQISQLRSEFSDYVTSMYPSEMDSIAQIHEEIGDLKNVLGCQTKLLDWAKWAKNNPRGISLITRLVNAGFGVNLSKKLISSIGDIESPDAAWLKSVELLTTGIKKSEWNYLQHGGVIMAMGRTGVGKTTTLAKLATQYVIEHGPENVVFINLDDQRVGSYDQLDTYAKILNVPVYRYDSSESMRYLLKVIRSKSLVLVDSAGMNEPDKNLKRFVEGLDKNKVKSNKLLLMSANTQLHNLREIVESYKECNPTGCVITKTDESSQLGNVLTVAIEDSLPIWYETFGQGIPDDISDIDPAALIQRAIECRAQTAALDNENDLILEGLNQYGTTE